jgi:hypothetical protein
MHDRFQTHKPQTETWQLPSEHACKRHTKTIECAILFTAHLSARSQAGLLCAAGVLDSQSLDSPDQRVAQDLPLLTASLSEVLTQLAAVPFNIIWYTHLTHQVCLAWLCLAGDMVKPAEFT